MALYSGDTVAVKVDMQDPFTLEILTGYTVTLDLYSPGRNPKTDLTVRNTPDASGLPAPYDTVRGAYIGYVDTTGFIAGTWSYRVVATGPVYHDTEFGTFRLSA